MIPYNLNYENPNGEQKKLNLKWIRENFHVWSYFDIGVWSRLNVLKFELRYLNLNICSLIRANIRTNLQLKPMRWQLNHSASVDSFVLQYSHTLIVSSGSIQEKSLHCTSSHILDIEYVSFLVFLSWRFCLLHKNASHFGLIQNGQIRDSQGILQFVSLTKSIFHFRNC